MTLKMRLLHLARVRCSADQHRAAREVQQDEDLRRHSVALGIGLELGSRDDREFRMMILQFLRCRTQK